jgi:hypothetical protein
MRRVSDVTRFCPRFLCLLLPGLVVGRRRSRPKAEGHRRPWRRKEREVPQRATLPIDALKRGGVSGAQPHLRRTSPPALLRQLGAWCI